MLASKRLKVKTRNLATLNKVDINMKIKKKNILFVNQAEKGKGVAFQLTHLSQNPN